MSPLQRFDDRQIRALLSWYDREHREFPWRLRPDPYWVWIAEIMSQQTRMATLVPYFHRFIERFPTVETLAGASIDDVYKVWAGLGYYSRARNIHSAAKIVLEREGFPRTLAGWLELPGVGAYTAAAVTSQCFGVREPVWDGNVLRVCARLAAAPNARTPTFREKAIQILRERMRPHDPSKFNQAVMELGALVCTPRNAECSRCPISGACEASARGATDQYPSPKVARSLISVNCSVWILIKGQGARRSVLLEKRGGGNWFSGLWDFPSELGGVAEPVLEIPQPLARQTAQALRPIRHSITHHKIALTPQMCLLGSKKLSLYDTEKAENRWLLLSEVASDHPPIALSTTGKKVLKRLLQAHPQLLA